MPISGIGGGQPYQPTGPSFDKRLSLDEAYERIDEITKRLDEIRERVEELRRENPYSQEIHSLQNERTTLQNELHSLYTIYILTTKLDPTDVRKRIDEINTRIDEIDNRLRALGPENSRTQEYKNLQNERGNLESELTDLISRGQNDQILL